jgi:hypothetical protein
MRKSRTLWSASNEACGTTYKSATRNFRKPCKNGGVRLSKVAKEKFQFIVAYYLTGLQKVKPCTNPKGKECDFATSMMNIITAT